MSGSTMCGEDRKGNFSMSVRHTKEGKKKRGRRKRDRGK